MKLVVAVVVLLFALAVGVTCPEHSYASCYRTGQSRVAQDGGMLYEYSCSCGDKWWVRG